MEATFTSRQPAVAAPERVVVDVELANTSQEPVRVLRWQVPADGALREPLFSVVRDGEPVRYRGRLAKRRAPLEEDYVTLAPGQRIGGRVDVTVSYDFGISGTYEIAWQDESLPVRAATASPARGAARKDARISGASLSVFVEGRPHPADLRPREPEPPGSVAQALAAPPQPIFSGACTADEKVTTLSAWGSAREYAAESLNFLNGAPSAARRFRTWFGPFQSGGTSAPWLAVRSNFSALSSTFKTRKFEFSCECDDEPATFAYVYRDEPYKVYLCGAFWRASNLGTDSRAGTLIHETSHCTVVADTQDFVYGQSAAKQLATGNPANARRNADNHEYFAENNPFEN